MRGIHLRRRPKALLEEVVDSWQAARKWASHLRHMCRSTPRAATATSEALRKLHVPGCLRSDWRPVCVDSQQMCEGRAAPTSTQPTAAAAALLQLQLKDDVPRLELRLERQQLFGATGQG